MMKDVICNSLLQTRALLAPLFYLDSKSLLQFETFPISRTLRETVCAHYISKSNMYASSEQRVLSRASALLLSKKEARCRSRNEIGRQSRLRPSSDSILYLESTSIPRCHW